MNERIKLLALQAEDAVFFCHPSDYYMHSEEHNKWQEQFAQLIIKECIAQAVKEEERYDSLNGRDCGYCSMAMSNFQGVLAEHFGVEE